jgi:hypothetical protein
MLILAAAMLLADGTQLVQPPLPGFKIGNQVSADGVRIVERIPRNERIERWTRMVTTQRFEGLGARTEPAGFLQLIATGARDWCPGVEVSAIRTVGGAAQLRVDCPLNRATRRPETFIMRAAKGTSDLHVYQVTWRRRPWPADVQWGMAYLDGVTVKR